MDVNLRLQPKQQVMLDKMMQDFVDTDGRPVHTIIATGGSRGGTKSHTLRHVIMTMLLLHPNTVGMIFRKTIKDLEENHIEPLKTEYSWFVDCYNQQKMICRLPNGSRLVFAYAEREGDLNRFLGHAYDYMGLDQAEMIEEQAINDLFSSNRKSGEKSTATISKAFLAYNPGGISQDYLKRIFVEKKYVGKERASNYWFLKTFLWDNFFWAKESPKCTVTMDEYFFKWNEDDRREFCLENAPYMEKFSGQPDHIWRAWVYGDFDTYYGQFFGTFSRDVHCLQSVDLAWYKVHDDWAMIGGLDFGNTTVLEVLYRDYEGNAYVDYELSLEDKDMSTEERAALTAQHIREVIRRPNMPIICDVNMKIKTGVNVRNGESPYSIYRRAGVNLQVVSKTSAADGRGSRVMFNRIIRDAMAWKKNKDGSWARKPRLFFVEDRVPRLLFTMPKLMTKKTDPEDFDKSKDDHWTDALKYGLGNLHGSFAVAQEPALTPDQQHKYDESQRIIRRPVTANTESFDYAQF